MQTNLKRQNDSEQTDCLVSRSGAGAGREGQIAKRHEKI